jgi:hypothetical protein
VFALLALITFAVAFILNLVRVDLGNVNLVILGLVLFSAHFVFGPVWAFGRRS